MKRSGQGACAAALIVLAIAGCGKNDAPAPAAAPEAAPAVEAPVDAAPAAVELHDVIDTNARYVLGISYPPAANAHPGLARALSDYAGQARSELLKAVDELGNDTPTAPYELSLAFDMAVDTPKVVAVSAEGSSYTGGAHGQPLVARFVWLPERQELLTAQALVDSPKGWQAVSDYTRDKLLEQAMLRAQGEDLTPEEQQAQVRNLSKMIDQGTTPDAANFAQFEPVMDAGGRIAALRFVFPPYQVGPYSDGTQTVDVPASVLLPHVAAGYRELFAHP
ncbi:MULTISPECIES: DUF3298 and DUF4163 domain-containing protein [Stenotrophomonas]|uniref:DUF3298 and DUF4163 domain-containing protein n=1 Tax=Stenotrophomonas TaxID=40323 RepID=UPI000703BF7C|nr:MULTISPECIES: DUF3298 and DUF4163 domain-containing protein [Stenotrophomonas]OZB67523.1 MAG: DUF3298 domain-containing protein [Xanthomonadales bacterium 14-68-21]KRG84863.1 hypothetical protein ABB33_10540 [Stenotrophomonas acidaminiphila]MCA7024714.1 DUF3298 and DUF4163 domain-containing protein [Stenotrophomonas acidaminiphila]MCE4074528.1 DUF3298 and DUF4163 domain-containing protein [Stenotrophomonas acidaminiphila]QOG00280.1 DUF4163 domain-containing protein [Stenotrophomonas sp. CW1